MVIMGTEERGFRLWRYPVLNRIFQTTQDTTEQEIEAVKNEWRKQGISEELIAQAEQLGLKWAEKMTDYHLRVIKEALDPMDYQRVRQQLYRKIKRDGYKVLAENWLRQMIK